MKSVCIAVLAAMLGACDKGVKPTAPVPPKSAPAAAAKPTVDQAPELEADPRALHHEPRLTSGVEYQKITSAVFKLGAAPAPLNGFTPTANHSCPIMHRMKLNATTAVEHTAAFEGKTVGFCCADCLDAWAAMSDDERRVRLSTVVTKQ